MKKTIILSRWHPETRSRCTEEEAEEFDEEFSRSMEEDEDLYHRVFEDGDGVLMELAVPPSSGLTALASGTGKTSFIVRTVPQSSTLTAIAPGTGTERKWT